MVEQRCKNEARKLHARERARLQSYIDDELDPYTQNHYLFENLANRRNRVLKESILLALQDGTTSHSDSAKNKDAIKMIVTSVFERNQKKSVDEHVAEEMEAVLELYGKVALKRVVDVVPMSCRTIFRTAPDCIRQSLDEVTDTELACLMKDSDAFLQKHRELTLKQEELQKGLELLASVL